MAQRRTTLVELECGSCKRLWTLEGDLVEDTRWMCGACGKTCWRRDGYATDSEPPGWDSSCRSNATLCRPAREDEAPFKWIAIELSDVCPQCAQAANREDRK
jgi:ribosomal protein S27AE